MACNVVTLEPQNLVQQLPREMSHVMCGVAMVDVGAMRNQNLNGLFVRIRSSHMYGTSPATICCISILAMLLLQHLLHRFGRIFAATSGQEG